MSPVELFDPSLMILVVLAAVTLLSSLIVVEHKSLVYSAFFLGIMGISIASIFALLGFTFVAIFHVAVYIGAAVVFILFSITMFEETPLIERPLRIIAAVSVLLTFLLLLVIFGEYFGKTLAPINISYRELASLLTQKYWFALVVAALTLVTTLIEAITLARREEI
ncbi:MAG TPA: NADH-quinone oxidoreductase subunit J [Candidatus Bathyarchaeia archaeon]|nr:MAG: hypothetical protein A3K70_04615 [Candidatus Bathyarchaeota archaeon RBG_16_48_13]HJX23819.1 NADH-quinone oxidoreductase subunit J [Candidatus Bathyarchaeia archaeon]